MKLFDLHCDTAFECYKRGIGLFDCSLQLSLESMELFSKWKQCFAIWIRDDEQHPYQLYKAIRDDFSEKIKENKSANFVPFLTVEGGAVIEDEPDRVHLLKEDGVKLLGLTWNGTNRLAGGANSSSSLTELGKVVIKKLNEEKIGCDLSHTNKSSFFAALELAQYPIASHSNAYSIVPHRRNLTDEQLTLLAQKGGLIGLCFYPVFIGEDVFEGVYQNIYHLLELGLQKNIAIGSDFDGASMSSALDSPRKILELYRFLCERGLEKDTLDDIFYNNANNFFLKL